MVIIALSLALLATGADDGDRDPCACMSPTDEWSFYDEYGFLRMSAREEGNVLIKGGNRYGTNDIVEDSWFRWGSYCYPWHLHDTGGPPGSTCSTNEFGAGKHCCQSFCFVGTECESKIPLRVQYVSFAICPDDADVLGRCPYDGDVKGPLVQRSMPECSCLGENKGIPLKFGDNYGRWCSNWDKDKCREWWSPHPEKSLTLQAVVPGSWCCESWCYVSPECGDAKSSYLALDLFFSYGACENDVDDIYYCKEEKVGQRLERAEERDENGAHALLGLTLWLAIV